MSVRSRPEALAGKCMQLRRLAVPEHHKCMQLRRLAVPEHHKCMQFRGLLP